jgi:hypothetical protein
MPLFYIAGVVALFRGILTVRQAAGMGGFGGTRGYWLTQRGGLGMRNENNLTTRGTKGAKIFIFGDGRGGRLRGVLSMDFGSRKEWQIS